MLVADVVDRDRRSSTAERCPGLIEPHTHPDLAAQLYAWVDVSGFTHAHVAGVEAVRGAAATTLTGQWIFAFGLDPILTDDVGARGSPPPRRTGSARPSGRGDGAVDAHALRQQPGDRSAGLTDDTPDLRAATTGRRRGTSPDAPREQTAMLPFVIHGLPTLESVDVDRRTARPVRRSASPHPAWPARSAATNRSVDSHRPGPRRFGSCRTRHEAALATGAPRHDADDPSRFRIAGAKLWYDGSPYTAPCCSTSPTFETDLCCCTLGIERGTRGRANFEPVEVAEMLSTPARRRLAGAHPRPGRPGVPRSSTCMPARRRADRSHRWRAEH
ncbi:MAG: hypothetical protein R2697_06945 [Ilumatobacteraceae bacterium]